MMILDSKNNLQSIMCFFRGLGTSSKVPLVSKACISPFMAFVSIVACLYEKGIGMVAKAHKFFFNIKE